MASEGRRKLQRVVFRNRVINSPGGELSRQADAEK
jgi:hypothetical protein